MSNDTVATRPRLPRETRRLSDGHVDGVAVDRHHRRELEVQKTSETDAESLTLLRKAKNSKTVCSIETIKVRANTQGCVSRSISRSMSFSPSLPMPSLACCRQDCSIEDLSCLCRNQPVSQVLRRRRLRASSSPPRHRRDAFLASRRVRAVASRYLGIAVARLGPNLSLIHISEPTRPY